MKKSLIFTISIMCVLAIVGLMGCSAGEYLVLKKSALAKSNISYNISEEEKEYYKNVNEFSSKFSSEAFAVNGSKQENFVSSPLAAYMTLAIAAECSQGETQSQIVRALNIDELSLHNNFKNLYQSIIRNTKINKLNINNTLWFDDSVELNLGQLDVLSNDYFTSSIKVPILTNNKSANLAVNSFIKNNTEKFINNKYHFNEETLFSIISTIYLQDAWNQFEEPLEIDASKVDFVQGNGEVKTTDLYCSYYCDGISQEREDYLTFFNKTSSGLKLKFILPKSGKNINDMFSSNLINEVNAIRDYNMLDSQCVNFKTRVLFPEFECKKMFIMDEILKDKFGINNMFDKDKGNFNKLANNKISCNNLHQANELKVTKKGILATNKKVLNSASFATPDKYEKFTKDFIINKAFGFILTTKDDVILFTGVVNKI